jgi:hypothetical protein
MARRPLKDRKLDALYIGFFAIHLASAVLMYASEKLACCAQRAFAATLRPSTRRLLASERFVCTI